jgi:hypothetical protein
MTHTLSAHRALCTASQQLGGDKRIIANPGLLTSAWSDESGRRRRVYRLTAAGRRELAAQTRTWRLFARAVDAVTVS